jgi:hypothetical protein
MVNQAGLSSVRVREGLNHALRDVRAGLRDEVALGISPVPGLDNDNRLFECGWSWGIVHSAPPVKTTATGIAQPEGVAEAAPYLYFTVVALDCIQNLFSDRTRLLGLLDEEQQRLAQALHIRWDLTQSYWSIIGRYGTGRWPLEDLPWRTTEMQQSDYLSLLVLSIVVQELANRGGTETDVLRVARVLEELAGRARVTRRVISDDDPAVKLHAPGWAVTLEGSQEGGGPRLTWELADFAPQLLKQTLRTAKMLKTVKNRSTTIALADRIWDDHLLRRRVEPTGLWDRPSALYPVEDPGGTAVSWYYTERVIGGLVTAADYIASPPPLTDDLSDQAAALLAEAEHMFDQELLQSSATVNEPMSDTIMTARLALRRAHAVLGTRPGTAAAIATRVLADLDGLEAARQNAGGAR